MPDTSTIIAFALVALAMVLSPGPNMVYLISRSICQGRVAGLISLVGVALGFFFYMLCAAFGITALLLAVPYAYDAVRYAGAAYLLYLAWQLAAKFASDYPYMSLILLVPPAGLEPARPLPDNGF